MHTRPHGSIRPVLAMACALFTVSHTQAAEPMPPETIGETLSKGGYVLYMRHASTEKDYADQVKADPADCSTQRTLSEAGWDEAVAIGAAFDTLKIPVAGIYSSQYCRAWQTARLAFGNPVKSADLNFEPAEEFTAEQTAQMQGRVVPMLAAAPPPGFNTVVVGHDDPFEAATGVYPEPQGVIFVVKPGGEGKFQIVGSIAPAAWADAVAAAR